MGTSHLSGEVVNSAGTTERAHNDKALDGSTGRDQSEEEARV